MSVISVCNEVMWCVLVIWFLSKAERDSSEWVINKKESNMMRLGRFLIYYDVFDFTTACWNGTFGRLLNCNLFLQPVWEWVSTVLTRLLKQYSVHVNCNWKKPAMFQCPAILGLYWTTWSLTTYTNSMLCSIISYSYFVTQCALFEESYIFQ